MKNAFNEINLIIMLWMVHHLWMSKARFVFNCYHHWSLIVFLNWNGMAGLLHSREGFMQGKPLAMIAYGIGVLPMIKRI